MNRWTPIVLLLLVAAAGWALYASVGHDVQKQVEQEQALFPGFDAGRVRVILAEHVARDWRIRIVRTARGGWALTDPSAVPANSWQIDHLLQVALSAHGAQVPGSERDPVQLGFNPPRMVLSIQEELDGKTREARVEVGGLDAARKHVNVRVRGLYLRVLRDLDTALDRQLDDFKTALALEFPISDVVRITRHGTLREGASAPEASEMELALSEDGWRCEKPAGVQLDPALVGAWLQGLAALQHSGYFDELGAPLSKFGLDQPELRIELQLRDGTKEALSLARPGHADGQVWYGVRESLGIVWGLEQYRALAVGWPLENLLDARVLRARRGDVTTITLNTGAGELYFTHQGKLWHVALRRKGEKALDKPLVADASKIEDLLGLLEKAELVDYRLDESVPETPEAPAVWVAVGGLTQGGWFGGEEQARDGSARVRYQRRGESACSLAPRELFEAIRRPIESYWSTKLADIEEHGQVSLALGDEAGHDLRYEHNALGTWSRVGSSVEAKELYGVLDALCFLRAERYLSPRTDLPWTDTLTIEFANAVGQKQKILIGRSREAKPGEEVEIVYDAHRAVAKDQDLHARLVKILSGP